MKKVILMIAFVTGIGTIASAQTRQHKTPQQRAEIMTKNLETKLNLSQDQSAKVSTILLAQANKMDSIRANKAQGDKKLNRQAFKNIRKSTDEQLSTVFNTEQKKAYEEMKAARKEKMKEKRGAAGNKEG